MRKKYGTTGRATDDNITQRMRFACRIANATDTHSEYVMLIIFILQHWAGHVARRGEWRGVHRVLVGKSEGKRPLGRPRRRWEDNIKMDRQEVVWGCADWMKLTQDRERWLALVSTVMNFRVPKMMEICRTS